MSANPMDLTGRTILVTGASSGIGREAAIVLSELNARVVLVARNRERLAETLRSLGGSGHIVEPFDLNNVDSIPAWLKGIVSRIGPLHGVAHCAGIYDLTPIRVLTAARLDEVMRANFSSAVFLTKALRQKGCHGDGASIVIVSSVSGLRGHSGILAYTASKTAVLGLVRSMAVELAGDGLRVNAVAPGVVITPMSQGIDEPVSDEIAQIRQRHPLGLGMPRDVANGIAFLLSGAARWITGTTLTIDGGYLSQ